ncbi:MAG: hypothetical protein IPL96_08625 [Holophagaceae bacterium]|nr:hypothetical protein [Holophagaceae bacterium]
MHPLTPLVFRPSYAQRAAAALLCAGSWLVGVRSLAMLFEHLPRLRALLRAAEAAQEPTLLLWLQFAVVILAAVVAGVILATSTLGLILVEGTQVMADELGLAVELAGLPAPLARRCGAGRLPWKHVTALGRRGPFFVVRGARRQPGDTGPEDPVLRFLLVEALEQLVLLILERSPHLSFEEEER